MKLPSFRRLFSGDYPPQFRQMIDILSVSLNNGIEVLYDALNNQLTLEDNIACTVKNVTLTVDKNGTPLQGGAFGLNNTNKVVGVEVISAVNQSNSGVFPTSHPFVSGTQSGATFNISNISGLQANQSYTITVVAYTE